MELGVFNKFRQLIFETSGIYLNENKVSLLTARIGKRMRTLVMDEHVDYFKHVVNDTSGTEIRELLNAISTNTTHFFREVRHFDFLGEQIKEMSKNSSKKIRIWCAASSTGEEPYSLVMTVLDNLQTNVDLEVVASDISTKVLQIAKYGVYRDQDVKDIPATTMKKYFQKGTGNAHNLYRVKKKLRDIVTYKHVNLSTPPFPVEGSLDFIFCRNVMIYFENNLKTKLVQNFHALLKPGGFLIVGMAESLAGKHQNFIGMEPSVYRKI